jgi:hypothetical protein
VEAVAEEFTTASGALELGWRNTPFGDRLTLEAGVTGTRYGSGEIGSDRGLRLDGNARKRLGNRLLLDADLSWWTFRRGDLPDFNVDLGRAGGRLAWAGGGSWVFSAGGRYSHVYFPDRIARPDTAFVDGDGDITVNPVTPLNEEDEQIDLSLGVMRRLGATAFVAAEAGYRWSDSNADHVDYAGPRATLRAGGSLPRGLTLSGFVGLNLRNFRRPVATGSGPRPVFDDRRDVAWQFGFTLERQISPRVTLFAGGSWLNQFSSVGVYGYDQSRFVLGVNLDVLKAREEPFLMSLDPVEASPLAPHPTPQGIRFRFAAPQAESVVLAGDFNGWSRSRHPLDRDAEGSWEIVVPLDPGVWRYAFVVDGDWVRPPGASRYEPDGFGGENGVVEILEGPGTPEEPGVTPVADLRPTGEGEPIPPSGTAGH